MHISQNHLSLVFASLDKNSSRALSNIVSNSSIQQKNKKYDHLKKIGTFQYLKRLKSIDEMNKVNYMPIADTNKKFYNNNERQGNGKWEGMVPTQQPQKFIPGKKINPFRSCYFHQSKSVDDLFHNN